MENSKLVIVVHYHEIWLKGGNRRFFLSKLHMALKRALEGLPVERILRPGDRLLDTAQNRRVPNFSRLYC